MVMMSHFILRQCWPVERTYYIVQGGWIGVDLFFVLSGFLITGILSDTRENPDYFKRFYKSRLLRIFPLYYTVVLIVWFTVVFVEKAPERLQGYDSFGWFFGFAPNIAMGLKNNFLYHSFIFNLNHLWSLAIEEQFYLFWPLIVRYTPIRWLAVLCVCLISISVPIRFYVDASVGQHLSTASYVLPFTRMECLAMGGFLAVFLRLDLHQFIPFYRWIARIICCWSGWELLQIFLHGTEHRLYTLTALFFGSLLLLSLNPNKNALVRRICENVFLRHLGTYSYGLYIFHMMFQFQWEHYFAEPLLHTGWNPYLIQVIYILLAFLGTYVLARVSWVLIEKPFLRLKGRH